MNATAPQDVRKESEEAINFLGTWRNQHGSEVFIQSARHGKILGTFKTGVGFHDPNEIFELCGFISNDLLTFAVNFGKHACLTSWSGHYMNVEGVERIETMWHLSKEVPDDDQLGPWAGVWTGSDTFMRSTEDSRESTGSIREPSMMPSHPIS